MRNPFGPPAYDPAKAHAYYEAHKHLKGRPKSTKTSAPVASRNIVRTTRRSSPKLGPKARRAQGRVLRLKSAVSKLEHSLSEAEAALGKKRQTARDTAKKNSDGKTTAKERQQAKDYRDKHKTEIANKRKKDTSGSSSSNSVSSMSVTELETRIVKIRSALTDAKRQLANASKTLGQLAHSDLVSESSANAHFAHFLRAERTQSL